MGYQRSSRHHLRLRGSPTSCLGCGPQEAELRALPPPEVTACELWVVPQKLGHLTSPVQVDIVNSNPHSTHAPTVDDMKSCMTQ